MKEATVVEVSALNKHPAAWGHRQGSSFLLQSKLCRPELPTTLIPRPELVAKLEEGKHRKLSMVVAPAGFGKTTLVLEWLRDCQVPTAWISWESTENEIEPFLAYLVAALRGIHPTIGNLTLRQAQMLPRPPLHHVLAPLLNELFAFEGPCVLVFDDVQNIPHPEIDQAIQLLLQHTPPQLHIVATSRIVPDWITARWRAQMSLTEIGPRDLRFSQSQCLELLNSAFSLSLQEAEAARLFSHTEGWVAMLCLVGASLQCVSEPKRILDDVWKQERFISDFLLEEVFASLPAAKKSFLLETSILQRLSPALCDALCERTDSSAILSDFESVHLFLVGLDSKRQWFRYHQLLQGWLQHHLQTQEPERWRAAHLRAARWYQEQEEVEEALHHYKAVNASEPAAQWLETKAPILANEGQFASLFRWLSWVPRKTLLRYPHLALYQLCLLDSQSDVQSVSRLSEQLLAQYPTFRDDERDHRDVPANSDGLDASFLGCLALARAHQVKLSLEFVSCIQWAEKAQDMISPAHAFLRGEAGFLMCRMRLKAGLEHTKILRDLEAMFEQSKTQRDLFRMMQSAELLVTMLMLQGELERASSMCQHVLALIAQECTPSELPFPFASPMYAALGELAYQRNQLEQAEAHLENAIRLALTMDNHRVLFSASTALARTQMARGHFAQAWDTIDSIKHISPLISYRTSWDASRIAQLALQYGQEGQVEQWRDFAEPVAHIHFHTVYRAIVCIHKLITEEEWQKAEAQIALVAAFCEANNARGISWELRLLVGQIQYAQGHHVTACQTVLLVLRETAQQGVVRLYLDAGQGLPTILARLQRTASKRELRGIHAYIDELLGLMTASTLHQAPPDAAPDAPPMHIPVASAAMSRERYLLDPVSPRELEVLGLIAAGYNNKELAKQLHISVATVKTHIRNLYSKLNVKSRTQAVQEARSLQIIA